MPESSTAVTPQRLFSLMMGFKGTAVLRTAIDLGIFDAVDALTAGGTGAADAAAVASRLGTDPRATRLLLNALAGLGLLSADPTGHRLAPGAADLLVSTGPRYSGGISRVASSYGEWEALGRLTTTVRSGEPVPGVDATAPDFGYWVDFAVNTTFATEKGAALIAETLAPWLDGRPAPRVLDAGAGSGAFGLRLAQDRPEAEIHLQDWAAVLDVAAGKAKTRGLLDQVSLLPGDVLSTALDGPYDVVVAGNLLFLYSPERAQALLERLAAALKPDGRLVVISFMTGEDPVRDEHAHLLNLLMLSWTGSAEILSPQAYREMAEAAGLSETELHERPGLPLRVLVARRPA